MTRSQLLQLLIQQAREQGFPFRKWYVASTGIPWSGGEHAVEWLSRCDRVYLLLFSHEFARYFWHSGERISYVVPQQTFKRVQPDGSVRTIRRRAHIRHSNRNNVWLFHLREMAAHAEPLRYIRRFLNVEEILQGEAESSLEENDD